MALLVKNLPANAGDVRDVSSVPELGRSPGGRNGNPLQYFCLENLMDRRAWLVTVYRVTEKIQLKWPSTHIHPHTHSHTYTLTYPAIHSTCIHTCIHRYIHIYIYIHTYIYIYTHTHTHTHTYALKHTHMYTYIFIHPVRATPFLLRDSCPQ